MSKNIELTKSNLFPDQEIFDLMKDKTKSIKNNLEIHLDRLNDNCNLIKVWNEKSLYGITYYIRENELYIKYIDDLKENTITITKSMTKKNIIDLIVKDIIEYNATAKRRFGMNKESRIRGQLKRTIQPQKEQIIKLQLQLDTANEKLKENTTSSFADVVRRI